VFSSSRSDRFAHRVEIHVDPRNWLDLMAKRSLELNTGLQPVAIYISDLLFPLPFTFQFI
jgi:hypothetical protein